MLSLSHQQCPAVVLLIKVTSFVSGYHEHTYNHGIFTVVLYLASLLISKMDQLTSTDHDKGIGSIYSMHAYIKPYSRYVIGFDKSHAHNNKTHILLSHDSCTH